MPDLDALYQEIILDHNRRPRNYGELPGADRTIAGRNPLCGDELTLWVRVEGDRIAEAKFVAQGCAVSKASASLMTEAIKGKSREEAERMFEDFRAMVTGKLPADEARARLGNLAVLSGVSRFPLRVKCASMAWHALKSGLEGKTETTGE